MSPSAFESHHPHLSTAANDAVDTACARQLELIEYRLRYDPRATLEECREALEDWSVDECLVLDLDLDDQLTLLENYGDDYGIDLAGVTLDDLRTRIESLSALVVTYLGEDRARSAFQEVEDLLEEHDLSLDSLLPDNPYSCFPHHAERDEPPWQVYEYRNLEGEGIDADVYELEVAGVRLWVRKQLREAEQTVDDDG
ncbi:MAG: hypothetical protein KDD11_06055 [Acidobacteria bacterium]|nr:hypothetical protein [Acidobacteriota bacterium]